MVRLTPPSRDRNRPRRRPRQSVAGSDDRGQFLLVGAFTIAVLLLVFAGVINTVTYTESLAAAGGDHPGSRDVRAFQADVTRGAGGIVVRINNETGDYTTKVDRFDRSLGNWSDAVGREYAPAAAAVEVSLVDTTSGSLISQSTVGNLTNDTGGDDWTLATSVPDTRRFQLRLDNGSLVNGSCDGNGCFEVVVDDGNSTWSVAVNQSYVVVEGPSTTGRCAVEGDPVTVDVTGGTVDGRACDPLSFAEGLSTPYALRYRNGTNAAGTYELVVNASVANDSDYGASGSPSVSPAIYAADIRLTYRTPELLYSNVVRVARGEPDDRE